MPVCFLSSLLSTRMTSGEQMSKRCWLHSPFQALTPSCCLTPSRAVCCLNISSTGLISFGFRLQGRASDLQLWPLAGLPAPFPTVPDTKCCYTANPLHLHSHPCFLPPPPPILVAHRHAVPTLLGERLTPLQKRAGHKRLKVYFGRRLLRDGHCNQFLMFCQR